MSKRRIPSSYYSIEPPDCTIDSPLDLMVCKHENIWHDDIWDNREAVDCFNFFLTKKEAVEARKKIINALTGQ